MSFPLCGDLIQYVHLGVCTPEYTSFPDVEFKMLPNGGVTLGIRHLGDGQCVSVGAAICSMMDDYRRDVGRETCVKRSIGKIRVIQMPSCRFDSDLGYRLVEVDEIIQPVLNLLNSAGLFRQFSKMSRNLRLPVYLATRIGLHPVWGWGPDGSYGAADWDGYR